MIANLIEQLLRTLVPPAYEQYLPVLTEGLQFFCEHLAEERRTTLMSSQMALGPLATPSQRLATLLQECPTLHKLGQLLARDPRLSEELRDNLQRLESLLPHSSLEHFPCPPDLELESPLAEGSVAITALCRYRGRPAVAKLLKAGLAGILEEEFAIWAELGRVLEESCQRYGIPTLDYQEVVESLTRLLRDELDPAKEQFHLEDSARRFRSRPEIKIPCVLACSTPHLTVMEKIEGRPFFDSPAAPDLLSTAVRALLIDPFFSPEEVALFHADPHPGNLMVTEDGRLAMLDWGSTLSLTKARREEITRQLVDLWTAPGRGSGALSELLDPQNWGSQLPADLLMLRKILFHLEGMVAALDPGHDLTLELFMGAALRVGWEIPLRLLVPFGWRGFPSHLSNLDLMKVGISCWSRLLCSNV